MVEIQKQPEQGEIKVRFKKGKDQFYKKLKVSKNVRSLIKIVNYWQKKMKYTD